MIKFQKKNQYFLFEKKFGKIKNYNDLKKYYTQFKKRFFKLNKEFKFCTIINNSYIDKQLKNIDFKNKKKFFLIPFGVKDIFNTKNLKTEFGSILYKNFYPGNNARLVDIIIQKQGIIMSKMTTAEFAVHYFPERKTLNPYNKKHITGTSSAGSAVSVACGALPIALGTQTAGSIIRPASFCGTIGFKPSFGALDRTGVLKTTDTLDTVGLFASDFYGLKKIFKNIIQFSDEYPYSKKFLLKKKTKIKGLICSDIFKPYKSYDIVVKRNFDNFCKKYLDKSFIKDSNKLDFINEVHINHELIYLKSLSYYFKKIKKKKKQTSPIMQNMIAKGNKISMKRYLESLEIQKKLSSKFDKLMQDYDFIITPSTASPAPKIGDQEKDDTSLIWTFLGAPSISIPIFYDNKTRLPFGLQLISRRYNDFSLLIFAEQITNLIKKNEKDNIS
jgi:Asp-tRNA(Asn)/Glu-tRNA(Gln) amidotransferase A subunit family amidase